MTVNLFGFFFCGSGTEVSRHVVFVHMIAPKGMKQSLQDSVGTVFTFKVKPLRFLPVSLLSDLAENSQQVLSSVKQTTVFK